MTYRYRVRYSAEDEKVRRWGELRWDIKRLLFNAFHILLRPDVAYLNSEIEEVGDEQITYRFFELHFGRDLTSEEKQVVDAHMGNVPAWGTVAATYHATQIIEEDIIDDILQHATSGKAYFAGFHQARYNIEYNEPLTDAEKAAVEHALGEITWA